MTNKIYSLEMYLNKKEKNEKNNIGVGFDW